MAWVYLDDQFPDHPKVVAAGEPAAYLFVVGLAYCKRQETEGLIPKPQVARLVVAKTAPLAKRLIEVGLWEEEGDAYRVHDYHEWNRPAESRRAAGRKAAQARWDKERNANGNAIASDSHSDRTPDAHASRCPPPPPLPTTKISSPPTEAPVAKPGERLMQAAARSMALDQAAAMGTQVRDHDAFVAAQTTKHLAEHRTAWQTRLAEHPDLSSRQLADGAGRPLTDTPEAIDARAQAELAQTQARIAELHAVPVAPAVPANVRAYLDRRRTTDDGGDAA